MIKKILVLVVLMSSLFAYDATVEIVKKMDKLPKIALQDASEAKVDINFRKKFFKILSLSKTDKARLLLIFSK